MFIASVSIVPPSVGNSCWCICSVPLYDADKNEWTFPKTPYDRDKMRQWEKPNVPLSSSLGLKIVSFGLWFLGKPYSEMLADVHMIMNMPEVGPYFYPYLAVYVDDSINPATIENWGETRIIRCPIKLTPKCDFVYSGLDRYEQVALNQYVHVVATAEWGFDEMLRKLA